MNDSDFQDPTTTRSPGSVDPFPRSASDALERRLARPPARRRSPRLNLFLFGATLVTTTLAGAFHVGQDPFSDPWAMLSGLPFSLTLLTILLFHEFGHYTLAMWHGIPTSLPYFIPGPPILVGTFGAFIRMNGMPRSRKALFDVGAAGPWAGMVVAVPAVVIGLALSEIRPLDGGMSVGVALGNSLLFELLSRVVLGVDPDSVTVILHPVALAGWFGLFVTFLNLLPVGQLDGGHVVYALFGRRHRTISRLFLLVVVGMGIYGWQGWFLWAAMLAFVLRVDHPDTADAHTPLDPTRRTAAWLTIGMFLVTFMPVPLSVVLPDESSRSAPIERRDDRGRWPTPSNLQPIDVSIPAPPVVASST